MSADQTADSIRDAFAAARARLDPDTKFKGTQGPFEPWESDHTGLVHVLWNVHRNGLSLERDADEIAALIRHSRWAAALRAENTTEERTNEH